MKRFVILIIVFFVTATMYCKDRSAEENSALAGEKGGAVKGDLYRGHGFSQGMALAKSSGKPMVLYFYTKWCGYCRAMDKLVFSDGEVADELRDKFIYVRIDTESGEQLQFKNHTVRPLDLAMMMGVQGFPTTVYLDKDQALITKIPGFMNRDVFLDLLAYISDKCYLKNVSFDGFSRKTSSCKTGG